VRYNIEGGTAKNGALDPLNKYFAVTSTDANIYIFSVPEGEDQSSSNCLKKIKITKQKVEPFGQNPLEI
jgi:hypothetical protein